MRIAIFVDTYAPYVNGVVTHVNILKEGLEKKGHEVLIVTAKNKIRHHYMKDGILFCPSLGFKNLYDYGLASPISRTRLKYLKKFNPDIIHVHQEFGIGLSGIFAAKSLNTPIVYTLHTMYDEYLYYLMPKKMIPIAKKIMKKYARFFATRASHLTGPSEKVNEYFKECGVDKEVHVIPNPVETDLFDRNNITEEQKNKIKKELNIDANKKILVFCGRLGHEKNLNKLFDCFNDLIKYKKDYHLLILGDSPIKNEFCDYVKKLDIENHVTFTGKIAHDELPPYYSICHMYITTSLSDTNSISMLEAMSMGLLVLHIKDDLNKDQVIDGFNGYIFNDSNDIIKKLDEFDKKSSTEQEKMRLQTINNVKLLNADALVNTLLQIYQKSI